MLYGFPSSDSWLLSFLQLPPTKGVVFPISYKFVGQT